MIAIVLVGPTGSGKTTVAKMLEQELALSRISTGSIARDLSKADIYTAASLEKGELAPELAMRAEVEAQIEAATATTGNFIVDGFPRTIAQLWILESVPDIHPLYFVVECDPLICLRRLIARERRDDHPDAVATRIATYMDVTVPMVEMLDWQSEILDGRRSPEELKRDVIECYQRATRELE